MAGKKLKVVELFAGVGGFRLGLEEHNKYEVVWSNQWEPGSKLQHASLIYEKKFKLGIHTNTDIEELPTKEIPDHDVLVGGFPCQDYSVATSLKNSGGLYGKKGVLWWQIEKILRDKGKNAPKYIFLENVDRLLKSPADQRGRDFAVMLASLDKLGYAVEWRVVNAAEYGFAQKRRRVFLVGFKKGTALYKSLKLSGLERWMREDGIMQEAFPAEFTNIGLSEPKTLNSTKVEEVSRDFNIGARRTKPSPFSSSGVFVNGEYVTSGVSPIYEGPKITLESILQPTSEVPESFVICRDERLGAILNDYTETKLTSEVFEKNQSFFNDFRKAYELMLGSVACYRPHSHRLFLCINRYG